MQSHNEALESWGTVRRQGEDREAGATRRLHPRLPTEMLAALRVRGILFGAELQNLSDGGAAIHLRNGLAPARDDCVELILIDGTALAGSVVWECGCEYGLAFARSGFQALDYLSFEHMGSDYFSSLIRFQSCLR